MGFASRRQIVTGLVGAAAALIAGCLKPRGEPLPPRAKAPPFSLVDQYGKTVTLASLLERGPAVVVFYRGFW